MSSLRGLLVLAAAGIALSQNETRGGVMTMNFSAAKANGNVRVFLTDLAGGTIDVNVAINGNWNATMKRNAILAALNAAAGGIPGTTFAPDAANGSGIVVNVTGGRSVVVNVYPRKTQEREDRLVVPGNNNGSFKGGHGIIDPHSPAMSLYDGNGDPVTLLAGVQIGSTDYVVELSGDDPIFNGASTAPGAQIANILYSRLTDLNLSGVTFSLQPGDTRGYAEDLAIGVDFAPTNLDVGIIFGSTSPVLDELYDYGFNGSMTVTAIPEPTTLALLASGTVGVAVYVRRRRRKAAPAVMAPSLSSWSADPPAAS